LSGGDHNTDLLNSLGELIRLNSAVIVQIKVLESLQENGFLVGDAIRFLSQLLLECSLKARKN
jgi:hypothetical protein